MSANIVHIMGTFISYLNNASIYRHIVASKNKINIFNILTYLLMSVINILVIVKLPLFIKPIYNLVCLGIVLYFIKKDSFVSITYYVFVLWLVGILLDILFMSFISIGLKYVLNKYPIIGMFIISLLLQLVLNLIFRIKKLINLVTKIKNKIASVNNITWIFLVIMGLIVFFAVLAFSNANASNNVLMILLLAVIVLLMGIFLLKILYEEKIFKTTIENLLENNKYYLEVNTQDRIFKHNIIHRLNSIKTTADDKTIKSIDSLIKDYNLNSVPNKNIDVLPNGINGIISRIIYGQKKNNLNIAINNYLKSDLFNALTPRKYNKLCETLGICLDNAVSAASKSNEKILQIIIIEDDSNIVIKIINTFKSSLEVDKVGTLSYTTKKNGHGLGLFSLIGRRDVILKTSIINNLFENKVTIKKKQ